MNTSRRTFIRTFGLASGGLMALTLFPQNSRSIAEALDSSGARSGFKVVENGAAQAVIVTADAPSAVVRYAATELQKHIERATGVKLEIVSEKNAPTSKLPFRIYVGPSAASQNAGVHVDDLAPNGFRNKTTAEAVFLIGKDDPGKPDEPGTRNRAKNWNGFVIGAPPLDDAVSMGSLFAVYDWLERQAGVKWLWPGENGTVVPKAGVLYVGTPGERTMVPSLIHSQMRISTQQGMDPARRDQYLHDNSVWLRRQRFARGVSFQYGHAFTDYWERFGTTHPEYFAMRPDGVRAPASKRTNLVQMCVSNPGLHQQVIADWQTQRKSLPWINGEENDGNKSNPSCTCDVCRSWDPPNAPLLDNQEERKAAIGDTSARPLVSLSDRYAKFWLALQKEGEKHNPNATVIGYAYATYQQPPVATKLNKRIIVGIVAPHPFPLSEQERQDFKNLWDGWAATGASLFLRPNFLLTGYCMPYIFARQLGEIYKYAALHGMIADDFDSLQGMWGVQGLNYYMLGRLNIDPTLKVEDILDEYYASFGPAASQMQKYFTYWEKVTLKCDSDFRDRVNSGWASVSKAGDEVFTPETFVQGKQLLQDAIAAAKGDAEVSQRLDYLNLWLQHADLCMQTLAAFHAQGKNPADKELKSTFDRAKIAVDNFRAAHPDVILNTDILRRAEVLSGWRKASESSES